MVGKPLVDNMTDNYGMRLTVFDRQTLSLTTHRHCHTHASARNLLETTDTLCARSLQMTQETETDEQEDGG